MVERYGRNNYYNSVVAKQSEDLQDDTFSQISLVTDYFDIKESKILFIELLGTRKRKKEKTISHRNYDCILLYKQMLKAEVVFSNVSEQLAFS